jgi:HlyD family secretion protein
MADPKLAVNGSCGTGTTSKPAATKLEAPKASANQLMYIGLGQVLILVVFGIFGTWSAFARLDSAVVAAGKIAAVGQRKTIQHYEGGIIEESYVREGLVVKAGELLMRLRPTQAAAQVEGLTNQLDAALALEARLSAERSRAPAISFPDRLILRADRPQTRKLIEDQKNQFAERRASLQGQVSILTNKIEQLKRGIQGLSSVLGANTRQLENLKKEFTKVDGLAQRGFYPLNRLNAMEREILELEGKIGQTQAEIARSEQQISETELNIVQLHLKLQEDVIKELRDTRIQIADAEEKLRVASDVYQRLEIRAPHSGMIQNLKFHTLGGVVRQGDPIMELAPLDDTLQIHARVSPMDATYIAKRINGEAEIRFPGIRGRDVPVIMGTVKTVSNDSLIDEQTREPYFLAIIEVKEAPPSIRSALVPGLPTEVVVPTGERTVLDYVIAPLTRSANLAGREQ